MAMRSDRPPDFLLIGAPKCGTTWLSRRIASHPSIAMPADEVHYFSRRYARGPDWYSAALGARPPGGIVGENSNSYLTDPEALPRILRDAPDARLICVLRDPVARAYSSYGMQLDRGRATRDIDLYLDPTRSPRPHIVGHGEYGRLLAPVVAAVDPARLLILIFEETIAAPADAIARVYAFLGVSTVFRPEGLDRPENSRKRRGVPGGVKRLLWPLRPLLASPVLRPLRDRATALLSRDKAYPPLDPRIADRLARHYAPDIARLERLLGRAVPAWRRPAP